MSAKLFVIELVHFTISCSNSTWATRPFIIWLNYPCLGCSVSWRKTKPSIIWPCHSFISYSILQLIFRPAFYMLIYLTSLYFWCWRPPIPNKIVCMLAPHNTQTKLKVFRSNALTLNEIDNLNIPFNSPDLLFFFKVNARCCLRIFVNSTAVTCSNKLSWISFYVTRSSNTIDTHQNQIKVSNPRQLTADEEHLKVEIFNWESRNKSIYLIRVFKKIWFNHALILTSVEEIAGKFDCLTTLLPQSVMEMFQRKSLRLRKYQERLERCFIERRIAIGRVLKMNGKFFGP